MRLDDGSRRSTLYVRAGRIAAVLARQGDSVRNRLIETHGDLDDKVVQLRDVSWSQRSGGRRMVG
jgi:hypothetical protein